METVTDFIIWGALKSLPGGSDGKESTCNTGDPGLIPVLVRSPGGGILSRLYIVTLII